MTPVPDPGSLFSLQEVSLALLAYFFSDAETVYDPLLRFISPLRTIPQQLSLQPFSWGGCWPIRWTMCCYRGDQIKGQALQRYLTAQEGTATPTDWRGWLALVSSSPRPRSQQQQAFHKQPVQPCSLVPLTLAGLWCLSSVTHDTHTQWTFDIARKSVNRDHYPGSPWSGIAIIMLLAWVKCWEGSQAWHKWAAYFPVSQFS